jgi:hypothetical protein
MSFGGGPHSIAVLVALAGSGHSTICLFGEHPPIVKGAKERSEALPVDSTDVFKPLIPSVIADNREQPV